MACSSLVVAREVCWNSPPLPPGHIPARMVPVLLSPPSFFSQFLRWVSPIDAACSGGILPLLWPLLLHVEHAVSKLLAIRCLSCHFTPNTNGVANARDTTCLWMRLFLLYCYQRAGVEMLNFSMVDFGCLHDGSH